MGSPFSAMLGGGLRAETPGPARPAPQDDFWYTLSRMTSSGMQASIEDAMTIPAFARGLKVLSGSVASLSLEVYRKTAAGQEPAPENPLYGVIHTRPNTWQTAYDFWQVMTANLIAFRRAHARILPGPRGAVDRLEPIRSDRVKVKRLPNGNLLYEVRRQGEADEKLTQEEVFTIWGFGFGELNPPSLIDDHRETVGSMLALNRLLGTQFANGVRLSGVVKHPGKVGDEAYKRLKETWNRQYSGVENAGKTAILEEGADFKEISQSNDKAQIFELWNFLIEELARVVGIPSLLLGHTGDKQPTFASAEQFFLSFVTHHLRPILICIEQAITGQLIVANQIFVAEFDESALLRGDAKARAEYYASGILNGWLTQNEARTIEGLNRKPGADDLLRPLNMTTNNGGTVPTAPGAALLEGYRRTPAGLLVPN